jgi:hypothetical protein
MIPRIRFMQNPVIQMITLLFAVCFVFILLYELFIEEPYYLLSAGDGVVYRINKKNGRVHRLTSKGMQPIKEIEEPTAEEKLQAYEAHKKLESEIRAQELESQKREQELYEFRKKVDLIDEAKFDSQTWEKAHRIAEAWKKVVNPEPQTFWGAKTSEEALLAIPLLTVDEKQQYLKQAEVFFFKIR